MSGVECRSERVEVVCSTNDGLEDLVLKELDSISPGAHGHRTRMGVVRATIDAADLPQTDNLRLVHHVSVVRAVLTIPEGAGADCLEEQLSHITIPEFVAARSFCVRCKRRGTHAFTSVEAERMAASGLREVLRVPVNLDDPDLLLRLDIEGEECLVLLRRGTHRLSLRHEQPVFRRTGCNPVLAAAMCHLARQWVPKPDVVLDPCCGGGTLLLEAAHFWPSAVLYASDLEPTMPPGVGLNLSSEGHALADGRVGDCRTIAELWSDLKVDVLLANPPFGKKCGRQLNFDHFYTELLKGASAIVRPGGIAVLLVWKRRPFARALALAKGSWTKDCEASRSVRVGNLSVGLEVLRSAVN